MHGRRPPLRRGSVPGELTDDLVACIDERLGDDEDLVVEYFTVLLNEGDSGMAQRPELEAELDESFGPCLGR